MTPDSFSDGGRYPTVQAAVERAWAMRAQGADLVDIGGESTRPGAEPVSAEEEARRVMPVIEALRTDGFRGLSVDTTKAELARRAVLAGVEVVNDISGLAFDPLMAEAVAASGAYLVLGHTRGPPRTMQTGPIDYPGGVMRAVEDALSVSMDRAESAGVPRERLLVDPGFGFGKTLEHNLTLLRELGRLRGLGAPIVVGTSRKRFLGALTGRRVEDRLAATLASVALAVREGAAVVRVHDVAPTVDVVRVVDAVVRI